MKNKDVKLIANFMNWPIYNPNDGSCTLWVNTPFSGESIEANHIKCDTSWDWLMLVVKKIELTGDTIVSMGNDREVFINSFISLHKQKCFQVYYTKSYITIDPIYKVVIKFIKWYNEKS